MKLSSKIMYRVFTYLGMLISLIIIVLIVSYIIINGITNLDFEIFSWQYNSTNASLMPAMINTLIVVCLAMLISLPLGLGTAIYLCEYTAKSKALVPLIRLTSETLAGIPSIVFGLFGSIFFSRFCGLGISLISGILTCSIMILPMIMRTSEEAILAVPRGFKEASFALGAGKLRTVFKIILPTAVPGILSGVLLGTGRIVGETVALLFTAGSVADMAFNINQSGRTLAVHMYALSNEGLQIQKAQATALILLLIVIVINAISSYVAKKFSNSKENSYAKS